MCSRGRGRAPPARLRAAASVQAASPPRALRATLTTEARLLRARDHNVGGGAGGWWCAPPTQVVCDGEGGDLFAFLSEDRRPRSSSPATPFLYWSAAVSEAHQRLGRVRREVVRLGGACAQSEAGRETLVRALVVVAAASLMRASKNSATSSTSFGFHIIRRIPTYQPPLALSGEHPSLLFAFFL